MSDRDWLDSDQFKQACARYWETSLHRFERIDELRNLIRDNYRPSTRTMKRIKRELEEKDQWIAALTKAES